MSELPNWLTGTDARQLLVTDWGRAADTVLALVVAQMAVHSLSGLFSALAGLLSNGASPVAISDFFVHPMRNLVAANGGVAGVGLWLTGSVLVLFGAYVARRSIAKASADNWIALIGFAAKTALLYATVLVVISILVPARSFDFTPAAAVPGTLDELTNLESWSRPGLAIRSFSVAFVCVIAFRFRLAGLTKHRPTVDWIGRALRGACEVSLTMTTASAFVVLITAGLQLSGRSSWRELAGRISELLATFAISGLDNGAYYLTASVDVALGAEAVEPVRGPAVVVMILLVFALGLARLRSVVRPDALSSAAAAGWAAGVGFLAGLCLVVAGALIGIGGEAVTASVLIGLVLAALAAATTPAFFRLFSSREAAGATPIPTPTPVVTLGRPPDVDGERWACVSCQRFNSVGARFCGGCGAVR